MSIDNYLPSERTNAVWPGIHGNVRREVQQLQQHDISVRLVNPSLEGHYMLDSATQARVNDAIDQWSRMPHFADELFDELPGSRPWADLSKRAIALHAFYNTGELEGPSAGIDPECMDWEIFNGLSARQTALHETPEKAASILAKYDAFFAGESMRRGGDRYGLSAHDYIAGSVDRIADVTRANAARDIIVKDALKNRELYSDRGVVVASYGSGLAEPIFWTANSLLDQGIPVDAIHMLDNDTFALAASVSRAQVNGVDNIVHLHRKNFIKQSPAEILGTGTVDYADLIGVFEYIPKDVHGYHMAANLLKQVAATVRPGGLIVFGNMVRDRAQQKWFEGIWPKLEQRYIGEVIAIVEEAGFSRDDLEIVITEGEGIYGVYALRMPESVEDISQLSFVQKKLGKVILRGMPEY